MTFVSRFLSGTKFSKLAQLRFQAMTQLLQNFTLDASKIHTKCAISFQALSKLKERRKISASPNFNFQQTTTKKGRLMTVFLVFSNNLKSIVGFLAQKS